MQIPNISVASLFHEMQALAGGGLGGDLFATQLTGQNLPASSTGASATASLAPAPLGGAPAGRFASGLLSALLAAQQAPPSPQTMASQVISAIDPGGNGSLSLSQVERAVTGGAASTSPQQMSIAGAFAKLDTNGDGALSQAELAAALQSLQQNDPLQALGGHRRHHHHHMEGQSAANAASQAAPPSATGPAATAANDADADDAASTGSSVPSGPTTTLSGG